MHVMPRLMSLRRMRQIVVSVLVVSTALAAGAFAKPVLRPGERMVFLGDSITEQRIYTRYVMNYFALRYPSANITFRNAGWGGDTAPGGLGRLQRDVLSLKPNVVSICFGMNDGGYKPFARSDYEKYMNAMTSLVSELKAAGVRVVLLTPGCIHAERATYFTPDRMRPYNATLALYAKGVEDLAVREKVPVYDLHTIMYGVQEKAIARDAKFTMIPDSVHPNPSGHAIMAYGLLKAMGCDEQPSGLTIDAKSAKIKADRCKVSNVEVSSDSLSFTRTDAALPMAFDSDAPATFQFFPIVKELDYYPLTVKNLQPGDWKLTVDGTEVGTFSAEEFAKGINMAMLPGPWQTLGEKINQASREQEDLYFNRWRKISLSETKSAAEAEAKTKTLAQLDEQIKQKEQARHDLTAKRDWQWVLTHQ